MGEEILDLLSKPTVKEKSLAERFRSQGGLVDPYAPFFFFVDLIIINFL